VRSRMSGATLPLPQYVFMVWYLIKERLCLHSVVFSSAQRTSSFSTESKSTSKCSQNPWTDSHPQLSPLHNFTVCSYKIHLNTILPATPSLPRGLIYCIFPTECYTHTLFPPCMLHFSLISYFFFHPNNIPFSWIQVFSWAFCFLTPSLIILP